MTFYGKYSKIFKRTKKVGTLKKLSKTKNYDSIAFESIKHVDEKGDEYWTARELQEVLDYTEWRKFENVINKAKKSCENSGISAIDHFVGADKMVQKRYEVIGKTSYLFLAIFLKFSLLFGFPHHLGLGYSLIHRESLILAI